MNKRLLFGLMAVSILAAGLLIWSCGDDIKVEFPHLGCFLGEPAFRLNTLIIDEDTTDNELGKLSFQLNPALDLQSVNNIFVLKDLSEENRAGPSTVIWAALSGLCGTPDGPATTPCTGAETDFFIDPISYDHITEEVKAWTDGNITGGNFSVIASGITLAYPVGYAVGGAMDIQLCDLEIAGTVNEQLSEIAGSRIESTYCPDGCGTIAWSITKEDFCEVFNHSPIMYIMPYSCQDLIDDGGLVPDTECAGEPAFSVRMLYTGTSVTLYEVP